jgi:glycosyltransferase involved in cell wall biosynthesis
MTVTDDRPLRIWHVNITRNAAVVDGITSAVNELAYWQRRLGHQVSVLRRFPSQSPGTIDQRPDIVHMHSVFRPSHAAIAYRLHHAGIPYVTSPHSGLATDALRRDWPRKRVYLALCEKRLMAHAATILCLTEAEAKEVRAVLRSAARCAVVPNIAPATTNQDPRWTPAAGRPNLVCLSRFDVWQKGLDHLALMAACLPEVDVTVYGAPDHNQPELLRRLRASAPSNFQLAEPVDGHDKTRTLTTASLYIQTSRWEGLSVSVLQAMTLGVPCAISTYIAHSMGLTDGTAALSLSRDPAHAATQIRAVLHDHRRLQLMAQTARERVQQRYCGDSVAPRSIAVYRSAINQKESNRSMSGLMSTPTR